MPLLSVSKVTRSVPPQHGFHRLSRRRDSFSLFQFNAEDPTPTHASTGLADRLLSFKILPPPRHPFRIWNPSIPQEGSSPARLVVFGFFNKNQHPFLAVRQFLLPPQQRPSAYRRSGRRLTVALHLWSLQ